MSESLDLPAVILVALLVAMAVGVGVALLLKRGRHANPANSMTDGARIRILESVPVDARRRLVLLRRDDVEHLVMIGGPSEFVVETNIGPARPLGLASDEASPDGRRAIKEAVDQHAPAEVKAGGIPADFKFDETELLQDFDFGTPAVPRPSAPSPHKVEAPGPIVSPVPPAKFSATAANDIRGFRDPSPRSRPGDPQTNGEVARDAVRAGPQDRKLRASHGKNGGDEEQANPRSISDRTQDQTGSRDSSRSSPSGHETTAHRPAHERVDASRPKPETQVKELPAARSLPAIATPVPVNAAPDMDEGDIEQEIVRALGMDIAEPQPPSRTEDKAPAAKSGPGEPRTRLGDLAERLEEALAREVRSASQARNRLDLDLDSFGFDRERGRNLPEGRRPRLAEGSERPSSEKARNNTEPAAAREKLAHDEPLSAREKPAHFEPAEPAKRENKQRPERQDNPPVISLSARRREVSDPLEDEMARLLGELTGDGSRR